MILTNSYSSPSARLLRDKIYDISRVWMRVTSRPERVISLLIRYGNSSSTLTTDTGFNSTEFIRLCASKLLFSDALKDKFYTPIYYRAEVPEEFPVIIRQYLCSSGGRGIIVCKDVDEFSENWKSNYHWTPYVNIKSEFRVHILGGEIVKVFRKLRDNEMEEEEYPIRNLHRGYHYSLINKELPKLKELVDKLHSLDFWTGKFYALDVGWTENGYFLLEANSAPGLNENTAELYAQYLIKELGL